MTCWRRFRAGDKQLMSKTCDWSSLYQMIDSGSMLLTTFFKNLTKDFLSNALCLPALKWKRLNDTLNVYNCYSFMYCRWYGFYLPVLISTSKGKDSKLALHCQEILLHCFDVCLPEMSSTHKNPHVLMTFNPPESIATEVFRNTSIFCQKNKILAQVFLTTTPGSSGSE